MFARGDQKRHTSRICEWEIFSRRHHRRCVLSCIIYHASLGRFCRLQTNLLWMNNLICLLALRCFSLFTHEEHSRGLGSDRYIRQRIYGTRTRQTMPIIIIIIVLVVVILINVCLSYFFPSLQFAIAALWNTYERSSTVPSVRWW